MSFNKLLTVFLSHQRRQVESSEEEMQPMGVGDKLLNINLVNMTSLEVM